MEKHDCDCGYTMMFTLVEIPKCHKCPYCATGLTPEDEPAVSPEDHDFQCIPLSNGTMHEMCSKCLRTRDQLERMRAGL